MASNQLFYSLDGNVVPVSDSFPGWVDTRTNTKAKVSLHFFVDLLCSDCADYHKIIEAALTTPFKDSTIADYINMKFTPIPLPYHMNSFEVAQVVPYL